MRYLSLSALFGHSIPDLLDKKSIQLERKKLFAELELSSSDHIEIHGIPITRNDIIGYFEDLQNNDVVRYHLAIGEDLVLTCFLEDHLITRHEKFLENELYEDDRFIRWVSPYFSLAFNSFTQTCFKESDLHGLSTILDNRLLMTDADQERSWMAIARIITNNIAYLEYYQAQDKASPEQDVLPENVSPLMEHLYTELIQLLPDSRFSELKDQYAISIMRAAIYMFNRGNDNKLRAVGYVDNAEALCSSPEVKTETSEKAIEMRRIISNKKKSNNYNIFRVGGIILFILFKMVNCNQNQYDSTRVLQNAPVYFTTPGDTVHHLITADNVDSFVKSKQADPIRQILKMNALHDAGNSDSLLKIRMMDSIRRVDSLKYLDK